MPKISQSPYQESIDFSNVDITCDMAYDLLTTEWICEKVRQSDQYAQSLYAALCNNDFIKADIWELLKEDRVVFYSWRFAGRIVADMQQRGEYLWWYCSGIQEHDGYITIPEGKITDEIREDLKTLGWLPHKYNYDDDENEHDPP